MKLALFGYGGHAKEVAAQIGQPLDFFVDDEYSNEYVRKRVLRQTDSEIIEIDCPYEIRQKRLLNEYAHFDVELLIEKTQKDFYGKKIAIDISILMYQVVIAIRNSGSDLTNDKGEITSHILGLFNKTL